MNARMLTLTTAATLCCGLSLAGARAATLSDTDRDFLTSTAQGTAYELAAAKLALTKAASGDVRSYARTMIADHGKLDPELHRFGRRNGVKLPTAMTDEKRRSYDHLEGMDGKAFDAAFVSDETSDNKTDIGTEQKEIDVTGNPQMKALVERLKQADTRHAKLGQALQQADR